MSKYDFLKGWEGKIVLCHGTEKKDGSVFVDQWKQRRQDYLYNGQISNQNLREKLPNEIDIEFDHKKDADFKEARKDADKWILKVKHELIRQEVYFYITDHKGKSPHIRFFIDGLEHYPLKYGLEYKKRLVEEILKTVKFKSDLVQLDRGLITSTSKLISLEWVPHWKEKWGGEIEEVTYENKDAKKPQVKTDIMEKIIQELNQSYKMDNKEITTDPLDIKDVNIEGLTEVWKKYYKEGNRNNLIMALGGICRRKDIPLEDASDILMKLLDSVGSDEFEARSRELSYSYERSKEDVAVLFHLKNVIPEKSLNEVYQNLRECFARKQDTEYIKVRLSQLNASYIGKNVSVDCQITGEQSQKALPRRMVFRCGRCSDVQEQDYSFKPYPVIFKKMNELIPRVCGSFECGAIGRMNIVNMDFMDHSIIFIRDLLFRDETFTQEKYEPKKVYVAGKTLPKTKTINVKGEVIIEPKTNNISIIATEITPLKNQIEDFRVTEEMKTDFKRYFNGTIDLSENINPDIVGQKRKTAKRCVIATLNSPCQIWNIERKKIIRGGINIIFYGDTKVAKSDLAKEVTNKGDYEVGEYVVAETGGRTGFLYTIDSDKGALIWGTLPLNDQGLIVIDGLQSIHTEEMGEFREALELQEVIVNRSIKGSALCRTRIIACLNPFRPMNNYLYKCEAVVDNFVFKNTPEVTRWDLYVPFCQKDVPSEDIAQRQYKEKTVPKDVFMNHIYWVWSRRPDQIEYTASAISEIKDKSQEFINDYSLENLPIVHNGIRDILTRLSVSKACELHSTDESNERVIVEKEHVTKAAEFYEEVLGLLELDRYKSEIEGKNEITDNEMISIAKDLQSEHYKILDAIKHEGKSSSQLSAILEVSDRTVKDYYKKLKEHGIVQTKQGQGIGLTVRGVQFVKWGLLGDSEIGKKSFTNKNDSEGKLPYFTNREEGGVTKKDEKTEPSLPVETEEVKDPETPSDKVLEHISKNPECSFNDIKEGTGIDEAQLDYLLLKLKEKGDIIEVRTDCYRVID